MIHFQKTIKMNTEKIEMLLKEINDTDDEIVYKLEYAQNLKENLEEQEDGYVYITSYISDDEKIKVIHNNSYSLKYYLDKLDYKVQIEILTDNVDFYCTSTNVIVNYIKITKLNFDEFVESEDNFDEEFENDRNNLNIITKEDKQQIIDEIKHFYVKNENEMNISLLGLILSAIISVTLLPKMPKNYKKRC